MPFVVYTTWYSLTPTRLHADELQPTIPAARCEQAFLEQRPSTADDELGVRVVDVRQVRATWWGVRRPSVRVRVRVGVSVRVVEREGGGGREGGERGGGAEAARQPKRKTNEKDEVRSKK